MTDEPNPAPDLGKALMALTDMFSGFTDLAAGARRQLLDAGFQAEAAERMAAEFTCQAITFAFTSQRTPPKPPSILDLFRRPE